VRAYIDDPTFEVNSTVATLTANRVPATIDQQPSNSTVVEGLSTSFSIQASHPAGAPLFYLWEDALVSPVSGRNTDQLTITAADIADDGQQTQCRVRAYVDSNQGETVTSNLATLTVELALQAPDWHTPIPDQVDVDTALPQSIDMDDFCDDADFYTNNGDGDLSGSILTIPAETRPDPILNCQVAATNAVGTTTSNEFTWEITGVDPVITTQPVPLVVIEPQGGTFTVAATHATNAPIAYRWEAFDGNSWVLVTDVLSDVVGGTSSTTMTLGSTIQADDGVDVRCRVRAYTGTAGTYQVYTNEVSVTVNRVPPVINNQPQNATVDEGEDSGFLVSASHPTGAPLFYLWTHDFADVSGAFTANLQVNNAALSDDGKSATCEVYAYEAGTGPSIVSNSATLTVIPGLEAPSWDTIPTQNSEVLDLPDSFDAKNYMDDGGGEIRSWGTDGPASVNGNGIVTMSRRRIGSIGNNAVRAENDAGESTSDQYTWNINPSVHVDDDFSGYPLGDLGGNGPWLPLVDTAQVISGDRIRATAGASVDLTGSFEPGDFDMEFTVTKRPNQIIDILEDVYIVFFGGLDDPDDPDDIVGTTIAVRESSVTYSDSRGGEFFLTGSNAANDTYGIIKVGNEHSCRKNGAEVGTFTGHPTVAGSLGIYILGLGNSLDLGLSHIELVITG
jgi:hypothetical protein